MLRRHAENGELGVPQVRILRPWGPHTPLDTCLDICEHCSRGVHTWPWHPWELLVWTWGPSPLGSHVGSTLQKRTFNPDTTQGPHTGEATLTSKTHAWVNHDSDRIKVPPYPQSISILHSQEKYNHNYSISGQPLLPQPFPDSNTGVPGCYHNKEKPRNKCINYPSVTHSTVHLRVQDISFLSLCFSQFCLPHSHAKECSSAIMFI